MVKGLPDPQTEALLAKQKFSMQHTIELWNALPLDVAATGIFKESDKDVEDIQYILWDNL